MDRTTQIVDATTRGDACYEGKTGWYYHELDEQGGIDVSTIVGPFETVTEATMASLNA